MKTIKIWLLGRLSLQALIWVYVLILGTFNLAAGWLISLIDKVFVQGFGSVLHRTGSFLLSFDSFLIAKIDVSLKSLSNKFKSGSFSLAWLTLAF